LVLKWINNNIHQCRIKLLPKIYVRDGDITRDLLKRIINLLKKYENNKLKVKQKRKKDKIKYQINLEGW